MTIKGLHLVTLIPPKQEIPLWEVQFAFNVSKCRNGISVGLQTKKSHHMAFVIVHAWASHRCTAIMGYIRGTIIACTSYSMTHFLGVIFSTEPLG